MSTVGQIEKKTQARVAKLFRDSLGYDYLGNWTEREDNSNIETKLLRGWLKKRGAEDTLIPRVLHLFSKTAGDTSKSLYDRNRAIHEMLRYGVKVKPDVGENTETVWLIDWQGPEKNHFAIAEEVAVAAIDPKAFGKRPDIVLYVNGIALGMLELKRSTVSVAEGIRQNLDNQKKVFIEHFFSTVQWVMADNDTEGMRYGTIQTPEKYYLTWKEDASGAQLPESPLDRALIQMCRMARFLELIHDFIVFDAGTKKLCRHSQYFGVRAAQEHVKRREGLTERLRQYDIYKEMLADWFNEPPETAVNKIETFEKTVKKKFIEEPGQMKLLIVVDKLLTGFDAPPATYLYIDKQMRDHGLFQAICRVNRLDGDDKEYGTIIDYKDLFKSLEGAVQDYTSGALDGYEKEDVAGLLEDRLGMARERLEETGEAVKALCEPVEMPKDTGAYLRFFCARDSGDAGQLKANESRRLALYRHVAAFVRAFNLANELSEAGYTGQITVSGIQVSIVRKAIKTLHLGVYPPNGRVRVAAPLRVSDDAVRLAVIAKLGWIRRQRARFEAQMRQSEREMVSGESHYFLGRRFRLQVVHDDGRANVVMRTKSTLELHVQRGVTSEQRERVLLGWYRRELRKLIPPLLEKWQAVLGVQIDWWGIKRMKTRWGSCNPQARRVWLNLELAKKPALCLEYLVVHELAHLIERHHNDGFIAIMDKHLPQWRLHREKLNSAPLAHETWTY